MPESKKGSQAPPAVSVAQDDDHRTASPEPQQANNPSSFLDVGGSDEQVPPPAYGEAYGEINEHQGELQGTRADVTDDGRVNIRITQQTRGLSSLLVPALRSQLDLACSKRLGHDPSVPPNLSRKPGEKKCPPLNVVIHVVGSRGDVQPFVALGKVLKEQHGHRVRLATHPVFRDFVTENGLEFFDIAGDPAELMAFMVKNPGLMPGFDTMRSGDIGRRRREIGNMIRRCWRSCIETGDGSGIEASDKNIGDLSQMSTGQTHDRPFVADAIIANPPSFAHVHCAEKLGIPLHMMFTMPWSPTQAFPHPLANIQSTNADTSMTNYISYGVVDMMTWQGLGDVINRFRQKSLGLEPISLTWAPGMVSRMKIPFTYCWSPALIPKPRDWASHLSISGFYFLSLASNYTPAADLAAFLDAGPPPVYIGFGSIVVDDPNAMTKLIFDAVKKTGQRALVSKGWGGFGADQIGIPEGVFMLGNVPHDWLFQRVSAVVHHGGAGTCAAGIAAGKPTVIVPFFGDQPFWGAMVARAGAGPKPIPYKELNADLLAESIQHALLPATLEKAKQLADSIKSEKGSENGADAFHKELDVDNMRCTLCPTRAAVWRLKRTEVKLSAYAAAVLGNEKLINFTDLKLYRPREHYTEDEPFDPITGGASALVGTMGSFAMSIADMPVAALKALNIHPDAQKSKKSDHASISESQSPSRQATQEGSQRSGLQSRTPSLNTTASDSAAKSEPPSSEAPTTDHEMSASAPKDPQSAQQPETAHEIANQMAQAAAVNEPASADSGSHTSQAGSNESGSGNGTYNAEQALKEKKDPRAKFDDLFGTGKGIAKMASTLTKSPMDFTLGLARGFHNAPKLYGDESVRQSQKVTDFQTGVKAAGKEFGYGMYDGISGLVTQPIDGARKEGAAGFFKGFAKGIGGIALKPGAAIYGLPGYTALGIYKELQKRFGPSVENYIVASRTAQGYEDVVNSTPEEQAAITRRWKELRPYIRKKKTLPEASKEKLEEIGERSRSRGFSLSKKKKASDSQGPSSSAAAQTPDEPGLGRTDTMDSGVWSPAEDLPRQPTSGQQTGTAHVGGNEQDILTQGSEHWEFDEAVRRSVAETSKGNAAEDAMIEKAIRASVAELEATRSRGAADHELQQAMEKSIREATEGLREERADDNQTYPNEKAVEHHTSDSGLGTEDDWSEIDHPEEEDEGLRRALDASADEHRERETQDEKSRREEEIVVQYMMRQSLAEEEMRQKRAQRNPAA